MCANLNDYSACLRLFLSWKAKVVPNRTQDIKNNDNRKAAPTQQDKQEATKQDERIAQDVVAFPFEVLEL